MNIPLYTLLIVYLLFLVVFFAFMFINLGHLINTGTFTPHSFLVTIIVFTITITVLIVTFLALRGVPWREPLLLINADWFTNLFNPSTSLPI
jgi:hypothetical protein